jgi:hypothetical protein
LKIAILTPCYSSQVNFHFMVSLMETIRRVSKSEVMFFGVLGNSVLPMSRNCLVAKAMAHDADKIIFIDDDVSWQSEDFQKLVLHDVKICAGVYQKRPYDTRAPAEFAVSAFPGGLKTDHRGLVEVDGAATGFMRIDREVFEAMKPSCVKLHDSRTNDPKEIEELYEYFSYGKMLKDGRTAFEGEDYNFCRKARAHGFTTYIDPTMQLGHHVGQFKFDAKLPPMALL